MAAVDYFLKIDGIDGESQDKSHKKEIEISSFSFGATNTGSSAGGSGGGSGKVVMQDFHFTMPIQCASPKLFLANCVGQHIASATLTCRKAGTTQQEFLKWDFTDLLISSYQTGGSAHGDIIPTDQVSFNFSKVKCTYQAQDSKGAVGNPVVAGYDIKSQQKL
jgi:type VI secretion system secreted protein Hcp